MNIARKTSLIVTQPTPFCNIDCMYCFVPDRQNKIFLSIDRLALLFERVFAFPTVHDEITIIWNSGEPLTLGPDYYEQAFDAVRRVCPPELTVRHAVPTNGMLVTDRWCDLFKRWNVHVAVSIDGPAELHDKSRITRHGGGTFDKTLAGIKCLEANDVPFNVLTVLGPAAIEQPDVLFAFYKDHGLRTVGMNIEEQKGANRRSAFTDVDDARIPAFFTRFTALMRTENFPIKVRELELTRAAIGYARHGGTVPNDQVEPFGIITFDVRGNVYTFSPELAAPELAVHSKGAFESFSIGNIFDHAFEELASSPNLRRMAEQVDAGTAMCRDTCGYFPVCGGGAPASKIFENGTFASDETRFCRLARQKITDFVVAGIEDMVDMSVVG